MSNVPSPPAAPLPEAARPSRSPGLGGRPDRSVGRLLTGEQVELAYPGRRLLARIIDIPLAAVIFFTVLGAVGVDLTDDERFLWWQVDERLLWWEPLALIVLGFLYELLMIAYLGQTLGKLLMEIKVVSEKEGGVPGLGLSLLRCGLPLVVVLVPFASQHMVLLMMFGSMVWNPMRQGYHDMLGRTLVIKL